jgi:hypothetical protein
MLAPDQQPLPSVLARALEQSIAAWDADREDTAVTCLGAALSLAQELSYL